MSPNTCLPVTEPNTLAGDGAEISHLQRGCRRMSRRDGQKTLPATQGLLPPSRGDFQGTWIRVHSNVPLLDVELRLNISLDFLNQAAILYVFLPEERRNPHV